MPLLPFQMSKAITKTKQKKNKPKRQKLHKKFQSSPELPLKYRKIKKGEVSPWFALRCSPPSPLGAKAPNTPQARVAEKQLVMARGLVPRGHLGFCHYERSEVIQNKFC